MLFVISLGPGNFSYMFLIVAIHTGMIIAINLSLQVIRLPKSFGSLFFALHNALLDGLSNLYIAYSLGGDEKEDHGKNLLVDLILLIENFFLCFWGTLTLLDSDLFKEDWPVLYIGLAIIWGSYLFAAFLKFFFIFYCHPWAELNRNVFNSIWKTQRKSQFDSV